MKFIIGLLISAIVFAQEESKDSKEEEYKATS